MNLLNQTNLHKKFHKNSQSGGFIEFIVAIVIAFVMLHLLGIDLGQLLAKPEVRSIALWIKDLLIIAWNDFLILFNFVKDIIHS